jgi:hypothetical protein
MSDHDGSRDHRSLGPGVTVTLLDVPRSESPTRLRAYVLSWTRTSTVCHDPAKQVINMDHPDAQHHSRILYHFDRKFTRLWVNLLSSQVHRKFIG